MNLTIQPFVIRDACDINLRAVDIGPFAALSVDLAWHISGLANDRGYGGIYWTGRSEEGVIALGGVKRVWPGVGEAWIVTSDLVEKYPLLYTRHVKRLMMKAVEELRLHRLQATVWEGHPRSVGWLRRCMGMHIEGYLEGYGPGRENFVVMARLFE